MFITPPTVSDSITNLVETFSLKNEKYKFGMSIFDYLVNYESLSILLTLKCETNKPSKYDLLLIKSIGTRYTTDKNIVGNELWADNINNILEFYKNRKII